MRTLVTVIALSSLASGCASVASDSAICAATERERAAHAAALAADGGDQSIRTGRALIAKIDAGCGEMIP